MRFAAEPAYSLHRLKAELVLSSIFQYFKTLYIFNSVSEIMNIYNPAKAGIPYKDTAILRKYITTGLNNAVFI